MMEFILNADFLRQRGTLPALPLMPLLWAIWQGQPFLLLGVLFSIFCIASYFNRRSQIIYFNDLLKSNEMRIAEGEISVLNRQPKEGHALGDIILIGGTKFNINFFYESKLYYNKTIAHGGTLTEGKYVRVYYIPTDKGRGRRI